MPGTPSPDNIKSLGAIGSDQKKASVGTGSKAFQSYMQEAPTNPSATEGKQISPMELTQGKAPVNSPTFDTFNSQIHSLSSSLGDISNQLNTPKLKLRKSSKYILKSKLSAANAHIQSANSILGTKEVKSTDLSNEQSPIKRFLAMVTDGQRQLESAKSSLESHSKNSKSLNPADMLLMQIKLNRAQQEIEFSSLLLSKAVDDMKMLFNIQL